MSKQPERLGDGPITVEYREEMNQLARFLDQRFNGDKAGPSREVGFILMVFPFGDDQNRCNYISNASRSDVVVMLKEQIKRFEGQPEIIGHA